MLASASTSAQAEGSIPRHPFPQHIAYASESLLPDHRTELQRDNDAAALYDSWKGRYVSQAGVEADGHPRYRVRTGRGPGAPTVSEAQGYGMILAVLFAGHDPNAQTFFDGLWEFALDHPSEIDARLMDWRVPADEQLDAGGNDSAFDADADIAYALLLASQQWSDGGRFDYRSAAAEVMAGLLQSCVGPSSHLPMLGDWVNPGGATYSEFTPRSSDFLPDHFRAFAEAVTGVASSESPEGALAPTWDGVRITVQATIGFVQSNYAPTTGLLPDFLQPRSPSDASLRPAQAGFLESPWDGDYYYNSTRVPLRLAIDALLNDDATSRSQVAALSNWAEAASGSDAAQVRAGYSLDGVPLPGSNYFTTAFSAPLGAAAMNVPSQQQWLNQLYDTARQSDEDYYEDTLSLLSVLVMTGNYWSPTTFGPQEVPSLAPISGCLLALCLAGFGMRAAKG